MGWGGGVVGPLEHGALVFGDPKLSDGAFQSKGQ